MDKTITIITLNIVLLTMFILSYYLNNSSNKGIYFGVRIPKAFQKEEKLLKIEKDYKKKVLVCFIILVILSNIILIKSFNNGVYTEILIITLMIMPLLIHTILFAIYYKKIKKNKENNGWKIAANNVVIVDTTIRKPKKEDRNKPLDIRVFYLPYIFPIINMILVYVNEGTIFNYEYSKIFLYQLMMVTFFAIIYKFILNSKVDLNSGSIEYIAVRKNKFKKLNSIFILTLELEMMFLYTVTNIGVLYSFETAYSEILINIIISATAIAFVIAFIVVGQGGRNLSKEEDDNLYKDDDEKWILGMFYFNKNDPAFMIEKRVGVGYTLNFANWKSIIFIIITIALIILSSIFG